MHVLFGIIGILGFVVSLLIVIIKARKNQPWKRFLIALAISLILIVIALIIRPSSAPAALTSAVSETSLSTAESTPTATAAPSATAILSEIPTSTPSPVPAETVVPTETPTPEPSPTVPPVSDEQLDEGYLDAWFNDSVMVGDSIAGGLSGYVTKERENDRPFLGNMRVIGTSGLTLKKALAGEKSEKDPQILFRSRFRTISEVIELTQATRLFLMIGVRDLEWYSAEKLVEVYGELISVIKANHPDLRIYVHSIMPTVKDYAVTVHLDYETRKETNERLRALCEENGYTYLELSELIRDEDGFLKYEYSGSDYSWHLNDPGKAIWVDLLRSCARDEYYAGIWSPEENTSN